MALSLIKKTASPKNIVLFRALQLGDLLCLIPALRALRAAYPKARVFLAGLPWAKEFTLRFNKYFDGFLEFPGYPGLPEQEPAGDRIAEFLRTVQERNFDLAIQAQGNGTITNPFMLKWGAKQYAGFYRARETNPDSRTFLPFNEQDHEIIRFLNLMERLGVKQQGTHLEFPISDKEYQNFGKLRKKFVLEHIPYVCLNPGARDVRRRWPAKKFAAIGDVLSAQGFRTVLTGSGQDRPACEAVSKQMLYPAVNLAGLVGLGELGAFLENSRVLVTNDTGASHMAAALKVRSVVVFSRFSDPVRWAPLDKGLHAAVKPKDASLKNVLGRVFDLLEQGQTEESLAASVYASKALGDLSYVPGI